jgi:N6-L-threonylcarbamoyladenine synthase
VTRVLALESSCDETACSVVEGRRVLSSVVASQIAVHGPFGGIVPELASREHLDAVVRVVELARERAGGVELDAIAVTEGPGLVGALLVGVQAAKGLALALGLPLFGVHHMEGHVFSTTLEDEHPERPARGAPLAPHLALLVSGGHTELVDVAGLGDYVRLGTTRDDAVGEAYDKVARVLGLGYPGGPVIDRLAQQGDPAAIAFPRAMLHQDNLDFSFAGLKTAVVNHVDRAGLPRTRRELCDLCASFQAAVVDVLVHRVGSARRRTQRDIVAVVGGVAANSSLRGALETLADHEGFTLRAPDLRYCGDNAAMIGAAAIARIEAGASPAVDVFTNRPLERLSAP